MLTSSLPKLSTNLSANVVFPLPVPPAIPIKIVSILSILIRAIIFYLAPLSYGIPSAFGACEFFDVNTSTTSVAMYGIIL